MSCDVGEATERLENEQSSEEKQELFGLRKDERNTRKKMREMWRKGKRKEGIC